MSHRLTDESPSLSAESPARLEAKKKSPVRISVNANGELVFTSDDNEALALVEQLAENLATPQKKFEVFHLEHAPRHRAARQYKANPGAMPLRRQNVHRHSIRALMHDRNAPDAIDTPILRAIDLRYRVEQ